MMKAVWSHSRGFVFCEFQSARFQDVGGLFKVIPVICLLSRGLGKQIHNLYYIFTLYVQNCTRRIAEHNICILSRWNLTFLTYCDVRQSVMDYCEKWKKCRAVTCIRQEKTNKYKICFNETCTGELCSIRSIIKKLKIHTVFSVNVHDWCFYTCLVMFRCVRGL